MLAAEAVEPERIVIQPETQQPPQQTQQPQPQQQAQPQPQQTQPAQKGSNTITKQQAAQEVIKEINTCNLISLVLICGVFVMYMMAAMLLFTPMLVMAIGVGAAGMILVMRNNRKKYALMHRYNIPMPPPRFNMRGPPRGPKPGF